MPEHASERDLLIESLPLGASNEQWAAFEERLLGHGPSCPPLVQLLQLRRGLLPPEQALPLQGHASSCPHCRAWVAAARREGETPAANPPQQAPAPQHAPPAAAEVFPSANPALEDWSVPVHSGTFASAFRHVNNPRQLLEELAGVLPELLEDVGLSGDGAEDFKQFGLRLAEDKEWRQAAAWLPRTLERFAREALHLTGLPCVLDRDDWEAVLTRTALRYLKNKPQLVNTADPKTVQSFYGQLLERGIESWQQAVSAELPPARSLEEQRRLAAETGVSEVEVRELVRQGKKWERSILQCCLSPTQKR
jgi:hypothetical protein